MLAKWVRTWDSGFLRPLLLFLARLGITPNALTIASLITIIVSALLLAQGYLILAGGVLLFGGLLDGIDGELARLLNCETPYGAFLDSISDHYGDFAVQFGLLWFYLNNGARTEVILIFLTLFGSIIGSQVRSRAGMIGIDTKTVGVFTRFERILILVLGLFANKVVLSLWVLAVINNFSAIQRIVFIFQAARGQREISKR